MKLFYRVFVHLLTGILVVLSGWAFMVIHWKVVVILYDIKKI